MPRNRMIKADFWADEKVGSVSSFARLLFIGMWTFADDIGIVRGNSAFLRSSIFPYDNITFEKIDEALQELESIDVLQRVTHQGEKYIHIKNFLKHQTINRPSTFRNIPNSDKHNLIELLDSMSTHGAINEHSCTKVKVKEKEKEKVKDKDNTLPSKVFDLWASVFGSRIKLLDATRKRNINNCAKQVEGFDKIESWELYFNRIKETPFLMGDGSRGWKASFGWAIKPQNMMKVLEGSYEGVATSKSERAISNAKELYNNNPFRGSNAQ